MGKIIRNGISFSGTRDTANNINYDNSLSGLNAKTTQEAIDEINSKVTANGSGSSSNIVYLTQAEYTALPDTKLTDDVEYRITDANTSTTVARNIAYDNSESGIEAVSVQGAIDTVSNNLQSAIDTVNKNLDTVSNNLQGAIDTVNESLGIDIKLIDGVPQWSERGADSFSPFNSESQYELLFSGIEAKYKDSVHQAVLDTNVIKGDLFDEYISQSEDLKTFTVKKNCDLILCGKTMNMASSQTDGRGEIIYNGVAFPMYYGTSISKKTGYGLFPVHAVVGDTIICNTPAGNGYPRQGMRIYLLNGSSIFSFIEFNNPWVLSVDD